MQERSIKLNKNGYEPFIDALKGFAIFFVVINHSLPEEIRKLLVFDLWGGMGVPVFLLIQSFHFYKKGIQVNKGINWRRVVLNVVAPFLLVEFIIVLVKSIGSNFIDSVISVFGSGKGGPGDYYIWIYLQFVVLLPIIRIVFRQLSSVGIAVFMILASALLEVVSCTLIFESPVLYKYVFFRYFFLIYLGYLWTKNGIMLNIKTLMLSVFSIISIIVFDYTDIDLSPIFYSKGWRAFHWICYFYTASLFIFFINALYTKISSLFQKIIRYIGRYSWEVFCTQLVVFSFLTPSMLNIENTLLLGLVYLLITISLSFSYPVLVFCVKRIRQIFFNA